jgi:hypothetical protein
MPLEMSSSLSIRKCVSADDEWIEHDDDFKLHNENSQPRNTKKRGSSSTPNTPLRMFRFVYCCHPIHPFVVVFQFAGVSKSTSAVIQKSPLAAQTLKRGRSEVSPVTTSDEVDRMKRRKKTPESSLCFCL